tara:strand:+ start:182 stop:1582 length:1401 start_codon:yes stop_codon:yes gene_type:complete
MPKKLPEEWINGELKSLNVWSDLGLKDCPVPNLTIYKNKGLKTKNLFCRWLPPKDEDIRDFNGKKRTPYYISTGFDDPFAAGKQAIFWLKDLKKKIEEEKRNRTYNVEHSLDHYWKDWSANYFREIEGQRGNIKKKNDTLLKWQGDEYGLSKQSWSKKSVDEINYKDMTDYWKLLDERGQRLDPPSDMAETKKQQRTLLNKLLEEARRADFPSMPKLVYPTIKSWSKDAVEWFNKSEWNLLTEFVVAASMNVADTDLTSDEYLGLDWKYGNRDNQKNWVDFYDALMTQWFFYTRAEDMPRLRMEWFREEGSGEDTEPVLYMKELKGDREKDDSYSYRSSALAFVRRMKMRRPTGWVAFDMYKRKTKNAGESQTGETLNFMLQTAVSGAGIKKKGKMTWTNIRHTAFACTVMDNPDLRDPLKLKSFAANGFTTVEQFNKTYLNKIDAEQVARESRKKIARKRSAVKK